MPTLAITTTYAMPANLPLNATSSFTLPQARAMECKLLFDRDLYNPGHVWVPDVAERMSAIYVDSQFYSFFKLVPEAQKALTIVARLGKRDERVALTLTKRGYAIWAYEPAARYAPPDHRPGHTIRPAFGPKPCLLLTEANVYEQCQIKVSDLSQPMDAITYQNRHYSIFQRHSDVSRLLKMAAKLARKGDDMTIVLTPSDYILGLFEPNGRRL
ncbi:MAG: hypothetical protein ACFCVD_06900 [Nodosilinea sp.]